MNFCNLEIRRSYVSLGEDNITDALICPALDCAKKYDRSVGFFSSSVFSTILPSLVNFYRNGGIIRLVCSPKLSEEDASAIDAAYSQREKYIADRFSEQFLEELQVFEEPMLQLLYELVAQGALDIRIAYTDGSGMYHDKMGILHDSAGNKIAFYGSANSSENGYKNNYERIRVSKSWIEGEAEYVNDEIQEFENLWNGTHQYVKVLHYKEAAKQKILEAIELCKEQKKAASAITLRSYQQEAIQAWENNGYHGFFVMATGTGKTWTAIFAAKRLVERHPAMVVICAPYKHLVKQWAEDVQVAFPNANLILVSSENPKWETQLTEAIIHNRYDSTYQIVVISTIVSFQKERFIRTIGKSSANRLLIVDEAHRFTSRPDTLKAEYKYLLGLSATPHSGRNLEKGNAIMDFFGGRVFNLPIENALGRYLVNYHYHPIYVQATAEEERRFQAETSKMVGCFRNGVLIDPDNFVIYRRNRLRIISMADNKISNIDNIMSHLKERDHVVVYCGDGQLFDDNRNMELRHIQYMKGILDRHGYRASQFTASENMEKRMELVDAFNKGEITALAAIRCLDEGINIPSIKSALILASNDDYREFVQRRGRILRQYEDKKDAHIYDTIVLPSTMTSGMAIIELRRYYEYARLALNSEELLQELSNLLERYELTMEQISMMNAEGEEAVLDE